MQQISKSKLILMGEGIANNKLQCIKLHANSTVNAINQFRKCIFQIKSNKKFYFSALLKHIVPFFTQKNRQESLNPETMHYLTHKAKEEDDDNFNPHLDEHNTLTYGQDILLQPCYSRSVVTMNPDKLAKQSGCLLLE
jgi:hypothetical protein